MQTPLQQTSNKSELESQNSSHKLKHLDLLSFFVRACYKFSTRTSNVSIVRMCCRLAEKINIHKQFLHACRLLRVSLNFSSSHVSILTCIWLYFLLFHSQSGWRSGGLIKLKLTQPNIVGAWAELFQFWAPAWANFVASDWACSSKLVSHQLIFYEPQHKLYRGMPDTRLYSIMQLHLF